VISDYRREVDEIALFWVVMQRVAVIPHLGFLNIWRWDRQVVPKLR